MDEISIYSLKKEINSLKLKATSFIEKAELVDRVNTTIHYEGYIQALEDLETTIRNKINI